MKINLIYLLDACKCVMSQETEGEREKCSEIHFLILQTTEAELIVTRPEISHASRLFWHSSQQQHSVLHSLKALKYPRVYWIIKCNLNYCVNSLTYSARRKGNNHCIIKSNDHILHLNYLYA